MAINFGVFVTKWRAAFICAAIYFHHLGVFRIVSFLFVGTVEQYGVDRNKASFPYFLRMTIAALMGPFTGYLGCKFRFDHLIMLGCLISALGIALCFIAESIIMVTLCWGLLLGVGNGLTLITTTFLSWNYKNDTSTANGISYAGSSIGGIVYTIIVKIFMDRYELSGTFLLISALTLHSVPAAMLLTDSRFPQKTRNGENHSENELPNKNKNLSKVTYEKGTSRRGIVCKIEDPCNDETCESYANLLPPQEDKIMPSELEFTEVDDNKVYACDCRSSINNDLQEISEQTVKSQTVNHASRHVRSYEFISENISEDIQKKEQKVDDISSDNRKKETFSKLEDASLSQTPINKQEKKSLESFRLFYNPLFILIAFLNSSNAGVLIVWSTTIGEYVVDKGFTMSDSAVLIVSCSVADFCGRIGFGWVTDRGFMSPSKFGAALYIVKGICMVLIALSTEKMGLNVSSFIYALACGALLPVFPALISENFDGDLKTMALSSSLILFFPISFIFPLLIGYFRDHLGSYLWMYSSLAAFSVTCALSLLLLSNLQKCKRIQPNP